MQSKSQDIETTKIASDTHEVRVDGQLDGLAVLVIGGWAYFRDDKVVAVGATMDSTVRSALLYR